MEASPPFLGLSGSWAQALWPIRLSSHLPGAAGLPPTDVYSFWAGGCPNSPSPISWPLVARRACFNSRSQLSTPGEPARPPALTHTDHMDGATGMVLARHGRQVSGLGQAAKQMDG